MSPAHPLTFYPHMVQFKGMIGAPETGAKEHEYGTPKTTGTGLHRPRCRSAVSKQRQHLGQKGQKFDLVLRPQPIALAFVKAHETAEHAVVPNGALQHGFDVLSRRHGAFGFGKRGDVVAELVKKEGQRK